MVNNMQAQNGENTTEQQDCVVRIRIDKFNEPESSLLHSKKEQDLTTYAQYMWNIKQMSHLDQVWLCLAKQTFLHHDIS